MRILHTSDWHLGRTFHGRVLDDSHAAFTDHLVELVAEEKVDAVVLAGDVYDRAIPPAESVRLLDDTLARLADRTRVILTPGNHDSARRLGFAAGLMREPLAVRARIAELDRPVIIPTADGADGLYVYALPYLDPDTARVSLPPLLRERLGEEGADGGEGGEGAECSNEASAGEPGGEVKGPTLLARSHEAVVSGALRLVARNLTRRRAGHRERVPALAMCHAFVVGGQASSDSERDIRVGGVDSVPSQVFSTLGSAAPQGENGLDYVALGHLHRPQEIRLADDAGPRLVYSGSPLALSFPEADTAKSSVLVDLGPGGVERLERITAPVPHRIATVRGTLEDLESSVYDDLEGAWVKVELLGPLLPDTVVRLKRRFPEMLALARLETQRPERERVHVTRTSDPVEIGLQFLAAAGGREPSTQEQEELRAAYESVLAARRS